MTPYWTGSYKVSRIHSVQRQTSGASGRRGAGAQKPRGDQREPGIGPPLHATGATEQQGPSTAATKPLTLTTDSPPGLKARLLTVGAQTPLPFPGPAELRQYGAGPSWLCGATRLPKEQAGTVPCSVLPTPPLGTCTHCNTCHLGIWPLSSCC